MELASKVDILSHLRRNRISYYFCSSCILCALTIVKHLVLSVPNLLYVTVTKEEITLY